jgi:hypothetical protein
VQVRVEQLTPTKATLVTLAGHPLCGAVRFLSEQRGDVIRFEAQVYDRPANLADWLAMRVAGDQLQSQTWESVVQAMVKESGGTATTAVRSEEEDLDDDQSERVEDWLKDLIAERKREQRSSGTPRKTSGKAGGTATKMESEATI